MVRHQILLVENDPEYASVVAEILNMEGFGVLTAFGPAEARDMAAREAISLAIMGIRLIDDSDTEDFSGFTLAEEFNTKFPLILLTRYASHEIVRRALTPKDGGKLLAVDFVDKSEGPERLLESIKKNLIEREEKVQEGEEVIAFAFFDDKIRLVSLTPDGEYRLRDEAQSFHRILYITTSETLALQSLVDELESLVNDPNAREQDFQDFFERNPDFIINDDYKRAHPHIVLSREDGDKLIPDSVLEPIGENSLSDLLELKLPSATVFILQKRRMRFSAAVFEACAQLREYSAFFDEEKNRQVIQERYGLLAYRPKMIVIIGRRGMVDPIAVRRIEQDLPNLYLRTYDDVINRMKAKVDGMKKGRII